VSQNRLIRAAPNLSTVVLALNAAFIFFGQGLGAALGGLSIDRLGLVSVGLVGGLVALGGMLLAALAGEPASASSQPAVSGTAE
jgi:predicted MFS family arabinose efflux permease